MKTHILLAALLMAYQAVREPQPVRIDANGQAMPNTEPVRFSTVRPTWIALRQISIHSRCDRSHDHAQVAPSLDEPSVLRHIQAQDSEAGTIQRRSYDAQVPHTPMSSFQSSGEAAMKSRIKRMHSSD
ncbi:MAG: hypothetical protein ACI841_001760 [Planctomycetota bacterium]|jgi:hypothetical protein